MSLYKKKIISNYISSILKLYKTFNFDFLVKLNIYNIFILFSINKVISTITISSGLKNDTDIKIINVLDILDFFFIKKTDINKLTSAYIKKSKSIIFVSRNTIQHWIDIYLLLFSLKKIIEPILNRKFIFLKFKKYNNGFSLYINDISSLDMLPDNLKKDKIGLKISFFFKRNYNIKLIDLFLNYFGF